MTNRPIESLHPGSSPVTLRADRIEEVREWVQEHSDDSISSRGFPEGCYAIKYPRQLLQCGNPAEDSGCFIRWLDGCGSQFVTPLALSEHRKICTERTSDDDAQWRRPADNDG
jgi:hypothetical protein